VNSILVCRTANQSLRYTLAAVAFLFISLINSQSHPATYLHVERHAHSSYIWPPSQKCTRFHFSLRISAAFRTLSEPAPASVGRTRRSQSSTAAGERCRSADDDADAPGQHSPCASRVVRPPKWRRRRRRRRRNQVGNYSGGLDTLTN
jgi:hypothetical protein